jgi:hypothetical protein
MRTTKHTIRSTSALGGAEEISVVEFAGSYQWAQGPFIVEVKGHRVVDSWEQYDCWIDEARWAEVGRDVDMGDWVAVTTDGEGREVRRSAPELPVAVARLLMEAG